MGNQVSKDGRGIIGPESHLIKWQSPGVLNSSQNSDLCIASKDATSP
jgi:hypothetical protein